MNEITKSKTFLDMEIENIDSDIYLSQTKYINRILSKYGMSDCRPVKTPIIIGEDRMSEETTDKYDIGLYQELIGELLYLANRTRPDIAIVTSYTEKILY